MWRMCPLPPMTRSGTRSYIRTRLRLAGARDVGIFTDDAIEQIVAYANGIPRIVNTVCDHCLLIGYADQTRRLDRSIVAQAIGYLEVGGRPRRPPPAQTLSGSRAAPRAAPAPPHLPPRAPP